MRMYDSLVIKQKKWLVATKHTEKNICELLCWNLLPIDNSLLRNAKHIISVTADRRIYDFVVRFLYSYLDFSVLEYVVGSKSFRPDQLFKVTEIKQICYFST